MNFESAAPMECGSWGQKKCNIKRSGMFSKQTVFIVMLVKDATRNTHTQDENHPVDSSHDDQIVLFPAAEPVGSGCSPNWYIVKMHLMFKNLFLASLYVE